MSCFFGVSVPCRGLNLYTNNPEYTNLSFMFPSPVGDLIYIRYCCMCLWCDDRHVSVPCRGLNLYTIAVLMSLDDTNKNKISVPCRGLNLYTANFKANSSCGLQFPSPVGDLIYIPVLKKRMLTTLSISVPCRGLNLYTVEVVSLDFRPSISVPCRGLNLYTLPRKQLIAAIFTLLFAGHKYLLSIDKIFQY